MFGNGVTSCFPVQPHTHDPPYRNQPGKCLTPQGQVLSSINEKTSVTLTDVGLQRQSRAHTVSSRPSKSTEQDSACGAPRVEGGG